MSTKVKALKKFSYLDPSTSKKKIDAKVGDELTVSDDCAKMFISSGRAEASKTKASK